MKLKTITDAYERSTEYAKLAPATQQKYAMAIKKILDHFDPTYDADRISRKDVLSLRDSMKHTPGMANYTVNILSTVLSFAVSREMLAKNPVFGVKRFKLGTRKPLTPEQINTLKQNLTGDLRRAFLIALYTSQRIGDILSMKWGDIRYDAKSDCYYISIVQQKTKQNIDIPLPDFLLMELTSFPKLKILKEGDTFIVSDKDWTSLTYNYFNTKWAMAVTSLGMPGVKFHGLRKNAAQYLAEAGCSENEIMAITGHKTSAMAQHYVREARRKKMAHSAMIKLEGSRGA